MEEIAKSTILQPLTLQQNCQEVNKEVKDEDFSCLFCDFVEKNDKKILQHIYFNHRTVIADIQEVADLKEYLEYWKEQFKGKLNSLKRSHI